MKSAGKSLRLKMHFGGRGGCQNGILAKSGARRGIRWVPLEHRAELKGLKNLWGGGGGNWGSWGGGGAPPGGGAPGGGGRARAPRRGAPCGRAGRGPPRRGPFKTARRCPFNAGGCGCPCPRRAPPLSRWRRCVRTRPQRGRGYDGTSKPKGRGYGREWAGTVRELSRDWSECRRGAGLRAEWAGLWEGWCGDWWRG